MNNPLLPPRMLFRFAVPCRHAEPLWSEDGIELGPEYGIGSLSQLDGQSVWADVRGAWSTVGLSFTVRVEGKRLPARCDRMRPTECDGVQLWIDTRDTHNIHRAGRFCHQFVFLPTGEGRRRDEPVAAQVFIARARENAPAADPRHLHVRSEKRIDGYLLQIHLEAAALTGFEPEEHPRLGFTYCIADEERGEQTFSCGSPFPYASDPSLWGTLDLVR